MALLTTNTKLKKSIDLGFKTFGIHLAPHTLSGKNVCPSASKGCANACLYNAGYGAYPKVKEARIKKTKLFHANKKAFMSTLIKEVETAIRRTEKNGLIPCFRLNLTSDIAWETIKIEDKNIFEMFPNIQFYDYTKNLARMMKFLTGQMPKNYHLTFSRSESNENACRIVMGMKGNVAVVYHNQLKKTRLKKKVISGDDHDLRFLDPKGVVIGLVAKGKKGKSDESGFVL
jgi:hypothetical protein